MYKIYLFTFPNGKKYCGYTSQTLNHRWNNGKGYQKCPLVYKAILKYGWDNIKKELIFQTLNQEEAFNKEKEIIAEFQLTNPEFGYNLDDGGKPHGNGNFLTEEGRKKISEASKRSWADPEKRAKRLETCKKNKPSQLCIEMSKIATSKRRKGIPPTNVIAVLQLDSQTEEIIQEYYSASEAAFQLTGDKTGCSNILNVCKGKRKTAYGFKWRYKN